jgi:hypothetical protein
MMWVQKLSLRKGAFLFQNEVAMTQINHSELCNLYAIRQNNLRAWETGLFQAAVVLATDFRSAMSAPESYQDQSTHLSKPYVDLLNFLDVEKKFNRLMRDGDINEQGILRVNLALTLEIEPNSYPKSRFTFPIGIQFSKGSVQYCFWDSRTDQRGEGSSWTDDRTKFVGLILERCKEYLLHDPKDGFGPKSNFGFLQT